MLSDDLLPGAIAAANFIGVTPRAVYHLVEAGHLPANKRAGNCISAKVNWRKPLVLKRLHEPQNKGTTKFATPDRPVTITVVSNYD